MNRYVSWLWLALACCTLFGCQRCSGNPYQGDAILADAAAAPSLEPTDQPIPEAFQKDALWNQAMQSEDDIDLASLADREGASGLLDALEVGGKVGQTALAALPMADDAPVAFRRLSQLVLLTQGSAQQRVMQTIFSIAETPIHRGEPIDDGGAELCAMALTRLVQDSKTPAPLRSLAISTLRLPAFVVFVDASTNPMTPGAPPGSASVDGP